MKNLTNYFFYLLWLVNGITILAQGTVKDYDGNIYKTIVIKNTVENNSNEYIDSLLKNVAELKDTISMISELTKVFYNLDLPSAKIDDTKEITKLQALIELASCKNEKQKIIPELIKHMPIIFGAYQQEVDYSGKTWNNVMSYLPQNDFDEMDYKIENIFNFLPTKLRKMFNWKLKYNYIQIIPVSVDNMKIIENVDQFGRKTGYGKFQGTFKIKYYFHIGAYSLALLTGKDLGIKLETWKNQMRTLIDCTLKPDDQEWMAENLNVEHYCNGDIIPQVQDNYEWTKLETGAWCYYKNSSENGKIYGKLYNLFAINDPRGLAPAGWHIPNDTEWEQLQFFFGGRSEAEKKMMAATLWDFKNLSENNESSFTALPAGSRGFLGDFSKLGKYCGFWSTTAPKPHSARPLSYIFYSSDLSWDWYEKGGFSVRCVKD